MRYIFNIHVHVHVHVHVDAHVPAVVGSVAGSSWPRLAVAFLASGVTGISRTSSSSSSSLRDADADVVLAAAASTDVDRTAMGVMAGVTSQLLCFVDV